MGIPDFKTFSKLAEKGAYVVFSKQLGADLETPVSAFLKIAEGSRSAFLFESVERGERIGRYSLLAARPRQVIYYDGDRTYIRDMKSAKKPKIFIGDPLHYMELTMPRLKLANPISTNGFQGGYVGFLGYESVTDFESIRLKLNGSTKTEKIPRSLFFLVEDYLVFDHVKHTLEIVVLAQTGGNKKAAYEEGLERIRLLEEKLKSPTRMNLTKERKVKTSVIKSNMTPAQFKKYVQRVKQYINAGDCIQVVLSQKFKLGKVSDPFHVYRALRSLNPSPYMFYFRHEDLELVGSSPEMLVKKNSNTVEVRPIAGTRPRGRDEKEDLAHERDLQASIKEHAEHLMLVDLGRNDIGRVCDYRTVEVKEYARIERYSHVMHLVSDVTGKLAKGKHMFDTLRATFPAGTVTGAPKVRAMEIIDELEKEERGPYAGSVGYLSFSGDMDMCITIRTIVIHRGEASVQAGAGIVYDSDPAAEYQETVNKAKALFKAVSEGK